MNNPAHRLPHRLSISLVVYRLNEAELAQNLRTLRVSCVQAGLADAAVTLSLIDNSESGQYAEALRDIAARHHFTDVCVHSGHGNVGYGAGHNLAIKASTALHHLILNPDIELDPFAINAGLDVFKDTGIVLLGAVGRSENGRPGYLSKRMPSVWVLFLRGFAPSWLRQKFDARLAVYECRDLPTDAASDVTLVSGAFMLCDRAALQTVGGFDERYFLHFEDLDLSLRMAAKGRVVSHPGVTLIHHGGHAAKRGIKVILLFFKSAFRFFNTHGWRWF